MHGLICCRRTLSGGGDDENPFMLFLRSMLPTFNTQPPPNVVSLQAFKYASIVYNYISITDTSNAFTRY